MEDYRLIPAVRRTDSRDARLSNMGRSRNRNPRSTFLNKQELDSFLRYVVSNYSEHDPYRPMGYFDSCAKLR